MGKVFNEAADAFSKMMEKLATGQAINTANEPINRIANSLLGGGEFAAKLITKKGGSISDVFYDTFGKKVAADMVAEGTQEAAKQATKQLDWGKIAGSYIGVSAAGRVLSGGGIYKDRHGNTNLIGIPFI